jgi:hypothetical protein
MGDPGEFAQRFVELWNETDPERRRRTVRDLWAAEGTECTSSRLTRGHEALETRVTASHHRNVRDERNRFLLRGIPQRNHDVIQLDWEMIHVPDGAVRATGSYVLILEATNRILGAYFFADS